MAISKVILPSFSSNEFSAIEMRQFVSALEFRFASLEANIDVSISGSDTYSVEGHLHTESDINDLQAYLLNITGESIFSLSDVSGTPSADDVLGWDATAGEFVPVTNVSGATNLTGLSDVSLGSLNNNDVLQYNSTTGFWENNTASDLLTDLTGQAQYDLLYNSDGSTWNNTDGKFIWNPSGSYLQLANAHSVNWLDTTTPIPITKQLLEFTSGEIFEVGHASYRTDLLGTTIRIADSLGTDWMEMDHDGTDFNTGFTNTTDWNITGITAIAAGSVDADFDAITATSYGGIAEADLLDRTANETISGQWNFDGELDVLSNVRMRFLDATDTNGIKMGMSDSVQLSLNAVGSSSAITLQDGLALRIKDSTNADQAVFSHDGTDFNTVFTNTASWNITSLTAIAAGTVDADFDAITATSYGGIIEASLLDKSASEAISGIWTFNAIPAFDGGTSGASSPFTVDSTFVVTNLNADLLDGNHASAFSVTGHSHVETDITDLQAYLLNITGEPLSDLSDATITAIGSGELLKWNGSAWINNTLAEAGIAAASHTHLEADITDLQSYLLNITAEPLSDLTDVTITAISSGEVLQWDGAKWINAVIAGGVTAINDLSDVTIASVASGELLKWDGAAWVNNTLVEAGVAAASHTHLEADITDLQSYLLNITAEPFSDLSDATITAIASGELLKWSGTAWINNTLAEAGISATVHTHLEADITDLQSYLLDITGESLSSLSDATITAIASGEVLKWSGAAWVNNTLSEAGISATSHTHLEADITDLQSYSLVGHTHLEADITDLQSYLLDITGESLSSLSDATITAIGANEILKWSGAAWINNTLAEAGIQAAGSYLSNIVEDTTPQLGGNLDMNGKTIAGIAEANFVDKSATETISGAWTYSQDINFSSAKGIRSSAATGNVILDVDTDVDDGSSNGTIRFNRATNTTGLSRFIIHKGNNSTSEAFHLEYDNTAGDGECSVRGGVNLWVRDGSNFRIYNSADTDYAGFSHNGTDFNTSFVNTTDWNITGATSLKHNGTVLLQEKAAAAVDAASYGQLWVKDDTPNIPMFTNDAGTDYQIQMGVTKFKPTSESITNDNTLSDDADLVGWTLKQNVMYIIEGYLEVASNITADFRFGFTGTGGFQDSSLAWSLLHSTGVLGGEATITTTVNTDAPSTTFGLTLRGYAWGAAGSDTTAVDFQWAQRSSNASPTEVRRGSWIRFTPMAIA